MLAVILPALTAVKAQERSCRYGFSFEISNDPHWGKNRPVITCVYPDSPAERAGILPYDIIEAVEGTPVTDDVLDDIYLFLNPEGKEVVELTVKNFVSDGRKIKVEKACKSAYSISESELATAFAMYAVEYTHERLFTCPFTTTRTKEEVDFSAFKSFAFAGESDSQPETAKKIIGLIKKEFMKRQMKYDQANPDLIVRIYYSFNRNPNYKPKKSRRAGEEAKTEGDPAGVYRYDITRDRMTKFPFLPPDAVESEAQYLLKLGFRLEDRILTPGRLIWECEANELLDETYSLENFAFSHIPLMCMQFPYMKYGRNVQFRISKKKYNYTGINYNIDNIAEIASVDPNSPADDAGILPFDKIDAIEDQRMDRTSQQFTAAYRQFLFHTLKLRDESVRFVDANGFPDCMYWDEFKYPQVAKVFKEKKYLTAFSYLFKYAPFINPSGNNTCFIKLRRGKEKLKLVLRPEIRTENTIAVE